MTFALINPGREFGRGAVEAEGGSGLKWVRVGRGSGLAAIIAPGE